MKGSILAGVGSLGLATVIAFPLVAQPGPTAPRGGPLTITSDVQEANARTGIVIARGNVRMVYPSRQVDAVAEMAEYDTRRRIITLRGNVFIQQENNTLRAEVVTYNINTGKIEALPAPQKQVQSVYVIKEDPEKPAPQITPTPASP
ncbi:MAG: LptA/OstA family protein [Gloeomargarita sp. GMQP_bins_120]